MRTAIDSSVLLCILRHQVGWELWRATLNRAATCLTLILLIIGLCQLHQIFSKFLWAILNTLEGLR